MYSVFWTRVINILDNSLLGRLYLKLVRSIGNAFKASWLYSFFAAHDMSDYGKSSKIASSIRKLLFGTRFSDIVADSSFVRLVCNLPELIFSSPVYLLSMYMLPSSILMFVSFYGKIPYMVGSALVIVASMILLGVKKSIGYVVGNSFLLGNACRYFGIKTDYKERKKPVLICAVTAIAGVFAGLMSFVLSDTLSLILFVGIMFIPALIASPLLLTAFTLLCGMMFSTFPATALAVLTMLVVLCRLFAKKESLPNLRASYILVMLYALVTLYYTFNGYGGSDGVIAGIIQTVFLAFFFVVTVVINSLEKFKKLLMMISLSSVFSSIYGIWQFITGQGGTGWSNDEDYIGGLRRISSTFGNPNVYGEFLIFVACITVAAFFVHKGKKQKILLAGCFGLQLINLALTYSRGCYIALVASLLIVVWCCDKRILGFGFFALPALPYVLPQNVLTRIASVATSLKDSSVTYRFSIWRAALRVIQNHWFVGSGIGTVAFTSFYQNYMMSGVTAQHSHNLFIQITIELSIVAAVLMILIMLFTVKDVCRTVKNHPSVQTKFLIIPLVASFAGIMLEGLVDYIFYNNIVYLMFWTVLALVIAGLNIINSDPEFDVQAVKE